MKDRAFKILLALFTVIGIAVAGFVLFFIFGTAELVYSLGGYDSLPVSPTGILFIILGAIPVSFVVLFFWKKFH